MSVYEGMDKGLMPMEKIIFNYKTVAGKEGRLELIRNTQITEDIMYALFYLHGQGLIQLDNALPIMEVFHE